MRRGAQIQSKGGRFMRTLFPTLLAFLVVSLALAVLISQDQTTSSGSGLTVDGEKISELGQGLVEAILLQRPRESDFSSASTEILNAQQVLKGYGYYSGPMDGTMNRLTREALRSFQESRQLSVTGEIDSSTAEELGLSSYAEQSRHS